MSGRPTRVPFSGDAPVLSRRRLLQAGATLAGAATLTACAGPSVGTTSRAVNAPPASDWDGVKPAQTISWWTNHPGNTADLERKFVDGFRQQSGITVNIVTAGANYDEIAQRLQAATGTNSLPDVVNASDVWWFRFMLNQQSMAIDGLMAQVGLDIADLNPVFRDDYKYGEHHWAVPYARSTPIFYYSKNTWRQAGLPDRAPQTWAEFDEWAPRLKSAVPGCAPLRVGQGSFGTWSFCNIMWGLGGSYSNEWNLTLDKQETLAAADYLRTMVNERKDAAVAATDTMIDFAAGLSPAALGSTGSVGTVASSARFEVGTGRLPAGPRGAFVPTGGTGLAVMGSRTREQQLAAGMFIKYMTEVDQQVALAIATGYAPSRKSVAQNATMTRFWEENPAYRTVYDQLPNVRSQDWARAFVPNGDSYLQTPLAQILLQNTAAGTAYPPAAAQIRSSFDQNVKPYL